ncbi:MAG: hypothetical protein COZ31_11115 [Nitrospirae bacterium CG_4_10_14_3_um_filter_44_29]|nr:MAG: hypothetical protein COZ31_11115 [Nitrospirae bacterium CG_4_10_14_3_um_filter_44_29]
MSFIAQGRIAMFKGFVTTSAFVIAIVSSGTALAADANPFGSLFKSLVNIANAAQQTDTSVDVLPQESAAISDKQIMADLLTQAGGKFDTHIRIGEDFRRGKGFDESIKRQDLEIHAALDSGNYSRAAMLSEILASSIARFAYEKYTPQSEVSQFNELSLADLTAMVGANLTLSLQAKKSSGTDIRNTIDQKTAARARSFLAYALANGIAEAGNTLNNLNKTIGTEAKASNGSALSGSAEMIVEKFNGNRLGFDQKYLGKTITASGIVLNIVGDSSHVTVRILGNKKKSNDERGFNDEIACVITAPQFIAKAGDLEKGKSVKVRGVYDHDTHDNMMAGSQINLSGCEILK